MGKSEYFEVRKVEGEVEQPQIILDADAIYDLLLRAELMMTKVDRMRYANRAIEQILDVIREFMLAYDFEDDRKLHLERMSANIAVFLHTMRIIAKRNIICIPTKFDVMSPDQVKHELMEHIAKLDEGATRWLKYCHYNDDRRRFEANECYKHNDILIRKYGFKFNKLKHKHNDKTRNRRQEEFPCLSRP